MSTIRYFDVSDLEQLRRQAKAVRDPAAKFLPEGWSRGEISPGNLVSVYPSLRLKPGYVLRAYHVCGGGNANAVVWATPKDSSFPKPRDCARRTSVRGMSNVPVPPDALHDVMDGIVGDGSPESYIQASLLARDLQEFGAVWHGVRWDWHRLLDRSAIDATIESYDGWLGGWIWLEPPPLEWRPRVWRQDRATIVAFYSSTMLYRHVVVRHADVYRNGYQFEAEPSVIAIDGGITVCP